MGVVRREGDWRLEKREEGVYEITYQNEPQEKILTSDYEPGVMDTHGFDATPVHEVDSYQEAEGLFEERAKGASASGFGPEQEPLIDIPAVSDATSPRRDDQLDEIDVALPVDEDDQLPPGGIALVALLTGAIAIWTSGFQTSSIVFLTGSGFLVLGLAIIAWAVVVTDDLRESLELLATVEDAKPDSDDADSGSERTPPAPEKLKDDLYFDRADQKCEWCGEHTDQPEVHHIVPRSEGGLNERSNLIVLCPNHHRKADAGAISRSKLKSKVRRLENK